MLVLDEKKMDELGFGFDAVDDVYFYVSHISEWLESHNKNYTKDQYYNICALKDALECLKVK